VVAIEGQSTVTDYSNLPGHSEFISLSSLGSIGLTAYFGIYEVCKLNKDSVFVVSGAAG
jgi:NADPH-dependent curcumin reductase CurA